MRPKIPVLATLPDVRKKSKVGFLAIPIIVNVLTVVGPPLSRAVLSGRVIGEPKLPLAMDMQEKACTAQEAAFSNTGGILE